MNAETRVGAVIVTYNNAAMLRDLLHNLYAQDVLPSAVLVVDNSSDERSSAMIRECFPSVQLVRFPENIGSAGGFYEGIRRMSADTQLVWLLDDDVFLPPDSLRSLLAGLKLVSAAAKVGAVRSWYGKDCPFTEPRKINTFAWRGTLVTAEAVKTIGLPKAEYFLYADDTEYAWRMVKNGFSIFWIPQSRVLERRETDRTRLRRAGLYARVYADKVKFYYAFRNQTHLYASYRRWGALVRLYGYALKVIFLMLCSRFDGRREKISAILRGMADGLRSRLGKNRGYTP